MPRIRRVAVVFWVLLVLTLTVLYTVNPELTSPERLVDALHQSGQPILLGYAFLSIVRAFTLVPSTVLIILGTLLFPDQPWFVMASSLAGIVISSPGGSVQRKHGSRVRWLEEQMRQKGFWIVVAWSAFPFVPTDIICYVAGTLRMNVWVFLCGVALGELPLVTFYVLLGGLLFAG